MKKLALTLTAITTLVMSDSPASGNDLVKVLSALQGNSRHVYAHPASYQSRGFGRDFEHQAYTVTRSSCDHRADDIARSNRSINRDAARLRAIERAEYQARLNRIAELKRLERLERNRHRNSRHVSFRGGVQDNLPVLPLPVPSTRPQILPPLPAPPVGVYPIPAPLPAPIHPHHPPAFGEIVTCEVPLYKRVRVRDRHNIACNARPMVVAIKDPSACGHACGCCANRVTYVRVMAPPCEPRFVKVSPCGRQIRMDFGKYEIDIVSYPNLIKVDYDN
ncbi:MAG: hypothetical protein AB8G99_20635 [Planctomycetaceae bacterium]